MEIRKERKDNLYDENSLISLNPFSSKIFLTLSTAWNAVGLSYIKSSKSFACFLSIYFEPLFLFTWIYFII